MPESHEPGDPGVDKAFGGRAGYRPRKPGHWVSTFAKDTRDQVMDRLVEQGVVRREKDKVPATDLDKKVFRDLDRKQVKARLKEIGEGAWAATAVKKSIEEIQAAVMVAVIAGSTAATAGSS